MLSNDQMKAAHFARQLDIHPDYKDSKNPGRTWGLEMYAGPDEEKMARQCEKDYKVGKKVLKSYTLSYSDKFTAGSAWQHLRPDDTEDFIIVEAGHIATSEAKRLAIFRSRK